MADVLYQAVRVEMEMKTGTRLRQSKREMKATPAMNGSREVLVRGKLAVERCDGPREWLQHESPRPISDKP